MRLPLLKLVPDNTNIDFLRYRWFAIAFSVVLVALAGFFIATRGLNLGVDFVGGQEIRATFTADAEAPVARLREELGALPDLGDPVIQRFGAANEVAIRLRLPPEVAEDTGAADRLAKRVVSALEANYPGVRIDGVDSVSGKVSGEFQSNAIIALLIAMAGVAIYIWIRFEWQFGVGAMVSLVHDSITVIGFYALAQTEFSLNAVAALLTLIGFSLNDTVVVYDRIRENLKRYRKMEMEALLNLSVNETLSRTVGTNGAVLLAVSALLIFGPEVIYDLTIGIFVGVIIGTYSSIYVARFLLVPLGVNPNSFVPQDNPADRQEAIPASKA